MSDLKSKLDQHLSSNPDIMSPEDIDVEGRLTVAKLGLDPETISDLVRQLHPPYDRVALAKIWGQIDRIKLVVDQTGRRWPALYSSNGFEGQNLITGEIKRSRVCFLPMSDTHEDAVELLREEGMFDPAEFPEYLKKAEEQRQNRFDTAGISFNIIFSAKAAKGAHGYRWISNEIEPVRKADPLKALRLTALSYRPSSKALPIGATGAKLIEGEEVK